MTIAGCTDIGCRYEENQDCYRAGMLSDNTAWLVLCDGMGGLSDGGKASRMAAKQMCEALEKALTSSPTTEEIKDIISNAAQQCSAGIQAESEKLESGRAMGTTIVVAAVTANEAVIGHCGDSRAYLMHKKELKLLTKDHSVVQELVDAGRLTPEQALHHPNRNIITRALGIDRKPKIDFTEVKLQKNDILMLCSDGLTNMISEDEIAAVLRSSNVYTMPQQLVKKAVTAGGLDNVTVVLMRA